MESLLSRVFCFLLLGLVCGCAPAHTCIKPTGKSCRACADLRKPCRDLWRLLPAAKRGDVNALHKAFAAARHQVSMPYVNAGEDAEIMTEHFLEILKSTGDATFAAALGSETPKTRSAVRENLFADQVKHAYPQTYALLASAPNIDWPSDKAYRQSWINSGQIPPEKIPWQ